MSFIFGGDTQMTPEALQRRRQIANAMMRRNTNPQFAATGLAQGVENVVGALMGRKLDEQQAQMQDGYMDAPEPNGEMGRRLGPGMLREYQGMDERQRLDFFNNPENEFVPPAPEDMREGAQEEASLTGGAVSDTLRGGEMDDIPAPTKDQLSALAQAAGITQEQMGSADLNATQSRYAGFLLRMMEAENTIRKLEGSNTLKNRALEWLPGQVLETYMMDPEYRRYMIARDNFNEAALRAATGATINETEMPQQKRNYFPLPNDDDATKDELRRQRQALIMSMHAASGLGDIVPDYGSPVVNDTSRTPPEPASDGWVTINGVRVRAKQ